MSRQEGISDPGADSADPPLAIEENAVLGRIAEEDERTRLEALRVQLAGTLRAVLAERLVKAPTEEFEAVQLSGKERLRTVRRAKSTPPETSQPSAREPNTARHREALSRLGPAPKPPDQRG